MNNFGENLIYDKGNLPERSLSTSGDANLNYQVSNYQKGGEYKIAILMAEGRKQDQVATTSEGRQVMEITFSKEVSIESAIGAIELLGLSFAQKCPKTSSGDLNLLKDFAQQEIFQGGTKIDFSIEDEKIKGNKLEQFGLQRFLHALPRQEKTEIKLYRHEYKNGNFTGKVHHFMSIDFESGKMKVRKEKREIVNNTYFEEQVVPTVAKLWRNYSAHLKDEQDFWKQQLQERLFFDIPPLIEVEGSGPESNDPRIDVDGTSKQKIPLSFQEEANLISVHSLTSTMQLAKQGIQVKNTSSRDPNGGSIGNEEDIRIHFEENPPSHRTSESNPLQQGSFKYHHNAIQELLKEYRSIPHPDVKKELQKKQAHGTAENPDAAVKADLLDRRGKTTHIYLLICAHINTLNKLLADSNPPSKLPYPPMHSSIESLDGILKPQPMHLSSEMKNYAYVQEQRMKVDNLIEEIKKAKGNESKQAILYKEVKDIVRSLEPKNQHLHRLNQPLYYKVFPKPATVSPATGQKRFQIDPQAIYDLEEGWKEKAKLSLEKRSYEQQLPPRSKPSTIQRLSEEHNHLQGLINIVRDGMEQKLESETTPPIDDALKSHILQLYKDIYKSKGNVKGSKKSFYTFKTLRKALDDPNQTKAIYSNILRDIDTDFIPVVLSKLQRKMDESLKRLSQKVAQHQPFPGSVGGKKEKKDSETWNASLAAYGFYLETLI